MSARSRSFHTDRLALAADLGVDITGLGRRAGALDGAHQDPCSSSSAFDVQMLSTSNPINDPGDAEVYSCSQAPAQMVPT
jgi:HAE1 family hydrophobic/amphiphilic exporter-1